MGLKKRIWKPKIAGEEHVVELAHGYWSGRREIRVDGNLVHQGRRLFDIGSQHTFSICGHECALRIATGLFGFRYGLRVDNQLVLASREYYDCVRVDWVFRPRSLSDYLAQASYTLGLIVCVILAIQLLLLFGGSVLGLVMLHFAGVYAVPAFACVLIGIIALFLPSAQVRARRVRAFKGIGFGAIMLAWQAFVWICIAPEMAQAL